MISAAAILVLACASAAAGYVIGRRDAWRTFAPEVLHLRIRPLELTREWDSDEPEAWSVRGMRLTRLQRLEWNNGVAGRSPNIPDGIRDGSSATPLLN